MSRRNEEEAPPLAYLDLAARTWDRRHGSSDSSGSCSGMTYFDSHRYTPYPKPYTLNAERYTLYPKSYALNPKPLHYNTQNTISKF